MNNNNNNGKTLEGVQGTVQKADLAPFQIRDMTSAVNGSARWLAWRRQQCLPKPQQGIAKVRLVLGNGRPWPIRARPGRTS